MPQPVPVGTVPSSIRLTAAHKVLRHVEVLAARDRVFGMLMLLPGMLAVRREIALLAALCVASYTLQGLWLGVLLVTVALVVGTRRPAWLEPAAPVRP